MGDFAGLRTFARGWGAGGGAGRFQATARTAKSVVEGELYGIDRVDFPKVAYFRPDFARLSLGALMNELALDPAGLLVTRQFVEQTGLGVGDPLQLTGLVAGTNQPLTFNIVGVIYLFPTAYPAEKAIFVANLEYLFTEVVGRCPIMSGWRWMTI